jgi:2-polyprenyl-3-methyl-5-hydroxy-6-metoxy-1,4-benzoquinol methylase
MLQDNMNLTYKFNSWRRRKRWNKQYKNGRWKYLQNDLEAKRYNKIIEYLKDYAPENPHILDVGCGSGILNKGMEDYGYASFTGIDFSSVSIEKAKKENFESAKFVVADVINYIPDRVFDVVIFNEVFYYIRDAYKTKVLDRLLKNLSPDGILITSIYKDGHGALKYFRENTKLVEIDFATVVKEEGKTSWHIGVYKKTIP